MADKMLITGIFPPPATPDDTVVTTASEAVIKFLGGSKKVLKGEKHRNLG